MSSPIIVGLAFFLYSSISAFITVNSVVLPDDFEDIALVIRDYHIKEIDQNDNSIKWTLEANKAELDQTQSRGRVKKAVMRFYEDEKEVYKIESKFALLNREIETIRLYEKVVLTFNEGEYVLHANELHFAQAKDDIEVRSGWHLLLSKKQGGYRVAGNDGLISKDFKSIKSIGDASLSKEDMRLTATEIELAENKPVIASGNAQIELPNSQTLSAATIIIKQNGMINAESAVQVKTTKVACFSDRMVIYPGADKSPQTAVFSGNPYIIQNDRTIFADSIKYDFATEQVIVEGNVRSKAPTN